MAHIPDRSDRSVSDDRDVYASPLHAIYITRREAADLLRVSPATIDTYYKRGLINKYKIKYGKSEGPGSGRALYKREELLDLVEAVPVPVETLIQHRKPFTGKGLAEQPEIAATRSKDEITRQALRRYDRERGHLG